MSAYAPQISPSSSSSHRRPLASPRRRRPTLAGRETTDNPYDLTNAVHKTGSSYFNIGPSADVWGGKWNRRGKKPKSLAIKAFRGVSCSSRSSKELCETLLKDAPRWKNYAHKNVVPFLGLVQNVNGQYPSVVMRLFKNGNALDYVKAHPQLEKLRVIRDIAAGLDHLHSLDPPVVHGNLRANNVFIKEDGTACISDIGLAQVLDRSDFYTSNSSSRFRWLAPEILEADSREPPYTTKSDIFAFAMTVIEIFTEDKPFQDLRHDGGVVLKITRGGRPSRPACADLPDELWNLIEQCWSTDPQQRPSVGRIVEFFK